ncbi:MAG: exo-alpha-sialidase [Eubacteriales bacterium]|nr:exo-alpha-sialidase [Eubacteriales bacterium]
MKEFLFEAGRYFPACHASTILPLQNGDVLAAYFAGTAEKASDVGIWLSRRVNGVWQAPQCAAKDAPTAHWNPVLFETDEGIRLCYKVGEEISAWRTHSRLSQDGGHTWSAPQENGDFGPVRTKPLRLSNGDWLAGNSRETQHSWQPFVDISRDDGKSFEALAALPLNRDHHEKSNHFSGLGAIQPALWQSDSGLHAFLRSTEGRIFRSDSADGGKSWSEAEVTPVPNNNSGIDVVCWRDKVFLVCNPVGANWGARYPLRVLVSGDDGRTFQPFAELEGLPDPSLGKQAEFSYPAAVLQGNTLFISYTHCRRQIVVQEITMA